MLKKIIQRPHVLKDLTWLEQDSAEFRSLELTNKLMDEMTGNANFGLSKTNRGI